MKPTDDIAAKRLKIMQHLEAALALADETGDSVAGFMIDHALDEMKVTVLSGNLDIPPSRH